MKTTNDSDTLLQATPAESTELKNDGECSPTLPGENPTQSVDDFNRSRVDENRPIDFGPLLFIYSRAQALADGVLVDVSCLAREAGFRFPVAMTQAAWETCVRVPVGCPDQDETGRLWDVLNVLRWSIAATPTRTGEGEIEFTVAIRQSAESIVDQDLKALCHPGDDAEPVITILLPDED